MTVDPTTEPGLTTTRFRVPAMDCATEKQVIANQLGRLKEVENVEFDLIDRVVTVHHRKGAEQHVEKALHDIRMAPERIVESAVPAEYSRTDDCCDHEAATRGREGHGGDDHAAPDRAAPEHPDGPIRGPSTSKQGQNDSERRTEVRRAWLLGGAGVLALAAEVLSWTGFEESSWLVIVLSVACIAASGPTTFRKAIAAARTLTLNINLLMAIAVTGAVAIGEWPEAAMVTFLFAVAELIEARSTDRARDAIRGLMALAPETARVQRGDRWVEVPAVEIGRGELVRVLPGERLPLDGKIASGTTTIDQAPITGESIPVERGPGDQVFAGTINQHGAFEIEVTAGTGDTTLARIARTIRAAQGRQAPTERFIDRFARWYTPSVVVLAIAIAAAPPLVTGTSLGPWLYKALVLLVIACPCALVISTPVTIVSGLAAAARRGILVKGGVYLEQAADLRMIAMDKTGTLTEGKPQLVDAVPLNGISRDELLQLSASLEATSTHPIAQAIVRGWSGTLLPVTDARNIAGKGLEGIVGGKPITIGSHRFAEERKVCNTEVEGQLATLESRGSSVMVVWSSEGTHPILGVLAVADVVRSTSIDAVKALHAEGIATAMLTGDNPTTAAAVGARVGIDEIDADLLPEDKVAAIDRLLAKHRNVAMVGDGVNDAPALARATIGFAMGAAGTDTALETADIALMGDDLRGVPELIALSRRTRKTLRANIALSIGIKAVFFALALAGIATLWMAVFADMGASLIVAANGLRLLKPIDSFRGASS